MFAYMCIYVFIWAHAHTHKLIPNMNVCCALQFIYFYFSFVSSHNKVINYIKMDGISIDY